MVPLISIRHYMLRVLKIAVEEVTTTPLDCSGTHISPLLFTACQPEDGISLTETFEALHYQACTMGHALGPS